MKYMLMIYGNEEGWNSFTPEVMRTVIDETDQLWTELYATGELIGAYGVADQRDAKMIRTDTGALAVTDGPFLEAKEYLGSFAIIDVDSYERAVEIAARNPASRYVGVEIRALLHEAGVEM